jgi:hypothetical protein
MKRDSGFLIFHFGMNVTFGMQAPKNCSKNMNSAVLAHRGRFRQETGIFVFLWDTFKLWQDSLRKFQGKNHIFYSNGNTRFQSFFMLTSVHPR